LLTATAGGVALGALSGRILFGGSVWILIPWAAAVMVLGLLVRPIGRLTVAAALTGYALVALFLITAYVGNDPLANRALFIGLLALIGPCCAIPLALLTLLVARRFRKHARSTSDS
jgi:hypothetical protein